MIEAQQEKEDVTIIVVRLGGSMAERATKKSYGYVELFNLIKLLNNYLKV